MRINSKDPAGTHASTGNEHLAGVHQSRASIRSPNLEHNLNDSRQERHNGSTHTPRSKPPSSAVIEPRSALPQRRDNDKCNVLKKLMNSFTFFNVLVLLFAWLICFFPAAEKPIEESPWVDFVRAQKQFGLIPRSTSILRQGYSDIRKVGEILDELSGSVLNSTLVFRKPIVSQLQTVLDSATEADYRLLELEEAIRRAFDNVIKASQRNIHELEILLAPRDALTGFIPKSIQAYAVRRKRRRHLVSACDEMLTEVKPFMELIEGLEASLQFQSDSATALNTYFRRNNFRTSDHIGELLADLLSRVGPGTRGNRHNARVLLSHFFSHMEEATRHVELIQLVLESIMATIHGLERKLADGTILDEAIFPVRRDIAVLKDGFAALEKYKDILG